MSSKKWEYNASTGTSTLHVSDTERVIRLGMSPPYMYLLENWGDFSLAFPIKGGWEKTLTAAMRGRGELCEQANRIAIRAKE